MLEFLNEIFTGSPSPLYLNMVLFGGFIVIFGLVSLFVKERLYLTESLVATLVGIAFGPVGLKVVMPQTWLGESFHVVMLEFSRIIIALQVMAVGVSTPGGYLKKHWTSVLIFLGPITCVMYGVSAIIVRVVLKYEWSESLMIAACITPTDPVLAHSVMKGKFANRYIPYHLRQLLAVESGANDGLGFPFLMLPICLLTSKTFSHAMANWTIHTWLYEIFFSILVGFILGRVARHCLRQSEKHNLIDKDSFLVFSIALTLLITGIVALMASDDLLAVFIAGNVFAWDQKFITVTEDSHISEVIDMLFNISYFVVFGAIIPWREFLNIGIVRLVIFALLILVFRRLPIVMMLKPWVPALYSRKEAFFAGWFGPMGVGAIFFSVMAQEILAKNEDLDSGVGERTFTVVCFMVLSSILIHGITVPITNFHMKKRAKLKVRRSDKIRQQMEDIAGALALESVPSPVVDTSIVRQDLNTEAPNYIICDSGEEWDSEEEYLKETPNSENNVTPPVGVLINDDHERQDAKCEISNDP